MVEEYEEWELKVKRKLRLMDNIEYIIEITENSKSPYPEIIIQRETETGHKSKWIERMTFNDPYEVEMLLKNILDLYSKYENKRYIIETEGEFE